MNVRQKHAMIQDTARYTLSNTLAQAIGVVNSVVLRRFLGPQAMGIWSILQVVLGYCGYASFGTTKAMARDYPYYRAKGEDRKANELKNLTLTFSLVMSLIPAGIILAYLGFRWQQLAKPLRFGLLFILFFLFIQRFYDLLMTLLRSDKKFGVLSGLLILNALGTLAVSLTLISWAGLYGLLAGTALVTFGSLWFIYRSSPYTFQAFWNCRTLKSELELGIPLVLSGFLFELLRSVDKWILARQLGFYEVGLYSVAMMVNAYVYSLPMMFAHVWHPNFQEAYGEGGSAAAVKNYLLTPVFILTILIPFLCGLAIFIVPFLAEIFLPQFKGGVEPMKFYLVGTYFLMLAQFSRDFLVRLDRYWLNIVIVALSAALNFFLNTLLLRQGWELRGVSLGSALSFAFCGIVSYVAASRNFSSWKTAIGNTLKLVATALAFFGGIFLIDFWIQWGGGVAECAMKIFIFALFSVPFFLVLEMKTALLSHFRTLLTKRPAVL